MAVIEVRLTVVPIPVLRLLLLTNTLREFSCFIRIVNILLKDVGVF